MPQLLRFEILNGTGKGDLLSRSATAQAIIVSEAGMHADNAVGSNRIGSY